MIGIGFALVIPAEVTAEEKLSWDAPAFQLLLTEQYDSYLTVTDAFYSETDRCRLRERQMTDMKKQLIIYILAGAMALSLYGCGSKEAEIPVITETTTQGVEKDMSVVIPETEEASEETKDSQETLSFSEFQELQFSFLSGAGGWATYMTIKEDGTFTGEYFDGEMGVTEEAYPNGTMYQSYFSGRFTEPVKVNEFTYSMSIAEITYENEPGTEEIRNGTLYCYVEAYGLTDAEEILLYAPGAPLDQLPEEYRSWVGYYDLSAVEDTSLPFWGLYNEAQECGFSSSNIVDNLQTTVAYEAEWAASLEESLENDSLTQAEMNETAQQLYEAWDYTLNEVWRVLQQTLEEDKMQQLTTEQREWIQKKEQAATAAGAEVEGGSMQPMVVSLKAAELTKERVYELLELVRE